MNLDIQIENVRKDTTSCNFCHRGELKQSYPSFVYPYENVVTFSRANASGVKVSICHDCLKELCDIGLPMLNRTPNVPVSDTTEADSSNADGNKKIPSIDWEGLETACEYWCHKEFSEAPPPAKVMEWLRTNINNYIK